MSLSIILLALCTRQQSNLAATTVATSLIHSSTGMWANAQRDGHPAQYRWRPLFTAAKFG